MANKKIVFSAEQQSEIEAARKNNTNKNTERRLCVLSMKILGKSNKEIASRTGYNGAYARRIIAKYFSEGIESIIGRKRQGNHRNLPYHVEKDFINGFIEQTKQGHLTTQKKYFLTFYSARLKFKASLVSQSITVNASPLTKY